MPIKIGFMEISRSRFKQSKISLLKTETNVVGFFFEFLGEFWVYLGGDSFSRRIGKIKRNKKY